MKRIHFDGTGPVWWHYPFWKPWGCLGCIGRLLLFLLLLFIFLLLLSQFRRCSDNRYRDGSEAVDTVVIDEQTPVSDQLPPINDDDVIDDDQGRRIVSNRLNVLFQAEVGADDIQRWINIFDSIYPTDDYRVIFCDINTKLMALEVPPERRRELIAELPEQIPDIPFLVFEEGVMDMGYTPRDPAARDADKSWHLNAIDAFRAWDTTKGSDKVIVAVVDSYFDLGNPELRGRAVVHPYNVWDGSDNVAVPSSYDPGNPDPEICHGTMVASLAIGAMDNNHGSAGIAPQCTFMPISLGTRFGCLAMLQGLLFAVNHGAQVVNISAGMSFAREVQSWPVDRQIASAQRELLEQENVWKYVFDMCQKYYVTIVWAAGNENIFTALDASKRGANTIKVSAVDRNLAKTDFSNFGNFADRNIFESTVSAPGFQVYGELPGGGSMPVDGTSFSAPIVTGCVGLMKSLDPTLTTPEIIDVFKATGRPVAANSTIGPIVQIGAALEKVADSFTPYSELKSALGSLSEATRYRTTLMRPLQQADADSTVLPPLVNLWFTFEPGGRGTVHYSPNIHPENEWTAAISYSIGANKITIVQPDQANVAGNDGIASFNSAAFTITPDSGGKAIISTIESESIPAEYTPYIKPFAAQQN